MNIVELVAQPLTKTSFAAFGDVIETQGAEIRLINGGSTQRFHDLATAEAVGEDARVIMNIFRGQPFAAPIEITMMERHPFGSQAFVPLQGRPYLVVVSEDDDGRPLPPQAFLARGDQGVNYRKNTWHHPLLSLGDVSDFLIVDRAGSSPNLEEYFFSGEMFRIANLPL